MGQSTQEQVKEKLEQILDEPLELRIRAFRFLEEALELAQAVGLTRADAVNVLHTVFERPIGQPLQEFGGVAITAYALAETCFVDLDGAMALEFRRIDNPAVQERMRMREAEKQAAGLR